MKYIAGILTGSLITFIILWRAFGILVLVIFAAVVKSEIFSEILAFSSAIIGTVMGFYFSNRTTNS
jgi:hypothetical protein